MYKIEEYLLPGTKDVYGTITICPEDLEALRPELAGKLKGEKWEEFVRTFQELFVELAPDWLWDYYNDCAVQASERVFPE